MIQACKHLLRAAMCVAVVASAPIAGAWAQSHLDTPLLVLRFNQERIYYQQPLYTAISRAVQAKPGVMFNIITLIPQTGDARDNQQSTVAAQTNTNMVVGDMVKMGVPQNRIRVSYQNGSNLDSSEMHLFVQ